MPVRLSGSAADIRSRSPVRRCLRTARRTSTASGCANCSPLKPATNLPPRTVPLASIRRNAHRISRQGTARFSLAIRSRKTTPQRTASCSATASASSSRSAAAAGPGSSDHRPAGLAPPPPRPRRSPRRAGGPGRPPRRSSDRTARKPSAVISPRATPSHRAAETSPGSRPVMAARSGRNKAPCWRSASSMSRVRPGPGSAGAWSPRAARSSQGRSSRTVRVIGVARDGTSPLRRGAGPGSMSRTDSRPQLTWPDRHASSSHSGR